MSDEHTVVAWDPPASRRSSDPPPTLRLAEYADCLAAFISALALSPPHVLGLSVGVALVIQLLDRHRAVPQILILAGAYAGWVGSLAPEKADRRSLACPPIDPVMLPDVRHSGSLEGAVQSNREIRSFLEESSR